MKNIDKIGMLQMLKMETEKSFEVIVQESFDNNPLANDPLLGGMHTYHEILLAGTKFKKDFIVLTQNGQLTEKEVNDIIDEVQLKILKKYFENFD